MIYTKEKAMLLVRMWVLNLSADVKQDIYSIMLYNSLSRCDYIPGISDADVLAILKGEGAIETMKKYCIDFCDDNDLAHRWQPHEIQAKKGLYFDLWMFTIDDLPDPSRGRQGIPYFRELWTHDFIQNAKLLFGRDIRERLQPPPIKEAVQEALRNISQAWDGYLADITDDELRDEILYLKVPTFLAYIRSALTALVVASGCRDWRKTTLVENLSKYASRFPYGDDALGAITLALNPGGIAQLDISEIRKLINRHRALLNEILKYVSIYTF